MKKRRDFRHSVGLFLIISIIFLSPKVSIADGVLTVPIVLEPQKSNLCWAASSQAIMFYYGYDYFQCEIANFARINSVPPWGNDDCCINFPTNFLSLSCNQVNYIWNSQFGIWDLGSIPWLLLFMGNIDSNTSTYNTYLSQNTIASEIDAGRPFIMGWTWRPNGSGGHALVGLGIIGDNLYYMNPEPGYGYEINLYDWVVNAPLGPLAHTWSQTVQLITNPTKPNLTPYQPSGWSDKIVVSNTTGTNIDSSPLYATDTLYVDWAVINDGTAGTSSTFSTELYVDGVLKNTWNTNPPLNPNFWVGVNDYSIGSLGVGTHMVKIDIIPGIINSPRTSTPLQDDMNLADNEYTKTITVQSAPSQYTLSVNINPTGSGSVIKSPDKSTYAYGDVVMLTATANPGYTFINWTGSVPNPPNPNSSIQITINGNTSITANFRQNLPTQYTLTVNITPSSAAGSVTKNPNKQTYGSGEQVTLTASPSSGYIFKIIA